MYFFCIALQFDLTSRGDIRRRLLACMPFKYVTFLLLVVLCCISFTVHWKIPPCVDLWFAPVTSDFKIYTVLEFDLCKGCFNSFVLFLAYMVRQWQFYFWINLFNIPLWSFVLSVFVVLIMSLNTVKQVFIRYLCWGLSLTGVQIIKFRCLLGDPAAGTNTLDVTRVTAQQQSWDIYWYL